MTNDSATPLPPDVVDELLSAELDGELDAAAQDLGLDAETVRERLAATPGIDARRAALTRARDVMAEIPVLDDATTARLVAAALPHARVDELTARRTARRSKVVGVVGIAAAIAVILTAVAVGTRDSGDKSQVASSPSAKSRTDGAEKSAAGGSAVPSLGEVSDPAVLRDRVNGVAAYDSQLNSSDRAAGKTAENGSTETQLKSGAVAAPSSTSPLAAVLPAPQSPPATLSTACLGAQARAFDISTEPVLTAAATFHGQPAVVVVYQVANGRQVLVVSPDGCTLLLAQLLT